MGAGLATLEQLLVSPQGAGLPASPLQLAIVRAAEGRPLKDVVGAEELHQHFGVTELPSVRPLLMVLICGVRGGKSWIASCAALHAALTADLSRLKPHELPRCPIVAPTVDAARATFVILSGIVKSSTVLSKLLDGEPTTEALTLRRPDGRRVEIVVVAAHRGGLSVRNRWLVSFVLEEVAQFGAESTGAVVNVEELLRAAETRLLPGCQGWLISSPFGPEGLLYQLFTRHFGKPSARALVVHAPTRSLNPSFPQERIDAIRAESPDVAAREYDAQWLDADSAFFVTQHIEAALRSDPVDVPPDEAFDVVAAIDPGTRANSWTLILCAMLPAADERPERVSVLLAREWKGSRKAPLSPDAVLKEIATIVAPYGVTSLASDIHMADALRDIALRHDLFIADTTKTASEKLEMFEHARLLLADGRLELPNVPELVGDLKLVRKRVSANAITVHLPKTPNGRHCDYAAALVLALAQPMSVPVVEEPTLTRTQIAQRAAVDALHSEDDDGGSPWLTEDDDFSEDVIDEAVGHRSTLRVIRF